MAVLPEAEVMDEALSLVEEALGPVEVVAVETIMMEVILRVEGQITMSTQSIMVMPWMEMTVMKVVVAIIQMVVAVVRMEIARVIILGAIMAEVHLMEVTAGARGMMMARAAMAMMTQGMEMTRNQSIPLAISTSLVVEHTRTFGFGT